MVDRRCAMTMTVRPTMRRSMALCTSFSLTVSSAEVASSRIRMGESCVRHAYAGCQLLTAPTHHSKCPFRLQG